MKFTITFLDGTTVSVEPSDAELAEFLQRVNDSKERAQFDTLQIKRGGVVAVAAVD